MFIDKLRTFYSETLNEKYIKEAAMFLEKGSMIIFPTDTVYAIGCLSTKENALARLANIKGAKLEHAPLSFIFEDIGSLSSFVKPMNSKVFKLMKATLLSKSANPLSNIEAVSYTHLTLPTKA